MSGVPGRWRKGAFAGAKQGGVLLPGVQDLLWAQGNTEIIWLSPAQIAEEMHAGSDRRSRGVFALSQQVLLW